MKPFSKVFKTITLVFVLALVFIGIGLKFLKYNVLKIGPKTEAAHPGGYAQSTYGGGDDGGGDS